MCRHNMRLFGFRALLRSVFVLGTWHPRSGAAPNILYILYRLSLVHCLIHLFGEYEQRC